MKKLVVFNSLIFVLNFGGCGQVPFEQIGEVVGQEAGDAAAGLGDLIRVLGQAYLDVDYRYVDAAIEYYNANLSSAPRAIANRTLAYEGQTVLLKAIINEQLRSPDQAVPSPTFSWHQLDGQPCVVLEPDDVPNVLFIAPQVAADARLTFQVAVALPNGKSGTAEIEAVILDRDPTRNAPPIADAGYGAVALPGSWVTLNGERSRDPEGAALEYDWEQTVGPPVTLIRPDEAWATFLAPQVSETVRLTFTLTVYDQAGATDSAEVQVTVQP